MPTPDDTKAQGHQTSPQGFDPLPFSPSNPPKDLHARPIAKSHVDRAGLEKALRQVGETSGA